jgi:hypothetical protein
VAQEVDLLSGRAVVRDDLRRLGEYRSYCDTTRGLPGVASGIYTAVPGTLGSAGSRSGWLRDDAVRVAQRFPAVSIRAAPLAGVKVLVWWSSQRTR